MANSIPDVALDGEWVDIYAVTGITPATAFSAQNKSSGYLLIYVNETPPSGDSSWGFGVPPMQVAEVGAGDQHVWLFGNGPVFVQVQQS